MNIEFFLQWSEERHCWGVRRYPLGPGYMPETIMYLSEQQMSDIISRTVKGVNVDGLQATKASR